MTAITTIAIILALFLGAAIVIAMRKHYAAEHLRLKVKSLNAKIQGYRGSANVSSLQTSIPAEVNYQALNNRTQLY